MILSNDSPVTAIFSSDNGFRLTSFKKRGLEVIDPTLSFFVGLHLDSACPQGPWIAEQNLGGILAILTGEETCNKTSLSKVEGQSFKLNSTVTLDGEILRLCHSVVSDTDSLVGNQFHLRLPQGSNYLEVDAKDHYYNEGKVQRLPIQWERLKNGYIKLPLNSDLNIGMHPYLNPIKGTIRLITSEYEAEVGYQSTNQESCWYIQYQRGNPYVSLGAVSSQNPWKPNLSVSTINLTLRVL